uniref:Defensin n=1 Tax=Rhipicephalus appendiculatus TaxID=34631 RepID=A0A131YSD1_RHIAP
MFYRHHLAVYMRASFVIVLLPCLIVALHHASLHDHDVHSNGHEAAVIAGAAGISPHDHTAHHQGVHYEAGAYGCPLLGFICKHHCLSIGHGSGYCGGPHLGRCICPIW